MVEYNTVILGAGISGISCAIYLKRAGIKTLIIENGIPGGQLNKASTIENYPGYSSIEGPDLAMSIYNQVQEYNIDYVFDEIESIDYDKKLVFTKDGEYHYKYLVFCTVIVFFAHMYWVHYQYKICYFLKSS